MLSREVINADEALRIGLVGKVYPHDQLMDEAKNLAVRIASGPSVGIELTKRALQRSLENDLKSQLDFETYAQNLCRQTKDHKEGVRRLRREKKTEV